MAKIPTVETLHTHMYPKLVEKPNISHTYPKTIVLIPNINTQRTPCVGHVDPYSPLFHLGYGADLVSPSSGDCA